MARENAGGVRSTFWDEVKARSGGGGPWWAVVGVGGRRGAVRGGGAWFRVCARAPHLRPCLGGSVARHWGYGVLFA